MVFRNRPTAEHATRRGVAADESGPAASEHKTSNPIRTARTRTDLVIWPIVNLGLGSRPASTWLDDGLMAAPIVLVPGFWLGAWAWDEVAAELRSAGHEVTALTLPGLESVDADRSAITMSDHVEAICDAVRGAGRRVVLVVHSGAGAPGYGASDRVPELIAAMVYVDTGPAVGPLDAEFDGVEKHLPSPQELAAEENLDGLTDEHLETFRRRAVPQPGAALREAAELKNDARLNVPSIAVCTAFPSDEYKAYAEKGYAFLAGFTELRNITWIDLPTSHWPMWSRPQELAQIIGDVARRAA